MFSLPLLFVTAQIILVQQGYSYEVDVIKLNSTKSYLSRNFNLVYSFNAYLKPGDGENETIIAMTRGDFKVMIIQRNRSLLAADQFQNDILKKTCTWNVSGDSFYYLRGTFIGIDSYLELIHEGGVTHCKNEFPSNRSMPIAATVYIGDPFSPGRSFTGIIALIEGRSLSYRLTMCFRSEDNSEFSDQLSLWSNNGGYVEERIPLLDVCEDQGRFVVINDNAVTGFDDIQTDYCDRIGGRYLSEGELVSRRDELLPMLEPKCRSEEDQASVNSWTANICEIFDFSSRSTNITCLPYHACFLCFIRYEGAGLSIQKEDGTDLLTFGDLKFIEGKNSDHFMLRSPSANITLKNKEWHLQFGKQRDAYFLNNSFLPFGKQRWHSKFAKDKSHQIILDNCLGFYCDNGKCLSEEEYCNGINKCNDGSDERDCDTPWHYDTQFNHNHFVLAQCNVSVVDIAEIEAKDSTLKMELKFSFAWRDNKVLFDAKKFSRFNGSKLPFNPSRDLALTDCQSETDVKLEVSNSFDFADYVSDSANYTGAVVWNNFTVKFELPCLFNYQYFPLGQQKCSLCFRFIYSVSKLDLSILDTFIPKWLLERGGGEFVLKTMSQTLYDESTKIKMVIHLDSLSGYHFLTSFTPSTLMCVISYCTLFFKLSFFSERIGVSSTVLLTLSILFNDVGDRIVKTSYIKLIDCWFIGCMAFTAAILIINTIFHYMMHYEPLTLNLPGMPSYKRNFKSTKRSDEIPLEECTTETSPEGATQGAPTDEEDIQGARTNEAFIQGAMTDEEAIQGAKTNEAFIQDATTDEEAIQGARTNEAFIQDATTDEAIQGTMTEEEAKDEENKPPVGSKKSKSIPLERKLNWVARVVLMLFLIASIFALLVKKW